VKEYRISFIGAGKVSGALCRHFFRSGSRILKIVSPTPKRGTALALSCNAEWSAEYDFTGSEDLIIVAVPDDKLPGILSRITCAGNTVVAHTAGSLGLDVFPSILKRTGVFYPLQTFSENRTISFKNLPFFIEASDPYSLQLLGDIAEAAGAKVHVTDTDSRNLLHVAAVFACNFANHMMTAGKLITERAGFSFEVLEPLISETISKVLENGPEDSQTGPAFRNDSGTIKRHIDLLSFSPELQGIYKEVTRSIIEFHNNRT